MGTRVSCEGPVYQEGQKISITALAKQDKLADVASAENSLTKCFVLC